MTDRSDAVVVTYQPAGRAPRRLVFEPRSGDGPDWQRVEEVRDHNGEWREVGSELVERVDVERP